MNKKTSLYNVSAYTQNNTQIVLTKSAVLHSDFGFDLVSRRDMASSHSLVSVLHHYSPFMHGYNIADPQCNVQINHTSVYL